MKEIMNNTKSSNQVERRFTSKFVVKQCLFAAKTLLFTIIILNHGITVVNAAPESLRPDIKIRNIINTPSTSPSVRIAKDPRNNTLYYLKRNGDIYQVNLSLSTSTLVYNSSNHNIGETQGMAIGLNGTIYLVGNADLINSQTKAIIVKGVINSGTGQRIWSILAKSAGYPKSKTAYDHRFNGVVVSPDGNYIYVNSGARTDHGEVQSVDGLYPNTREVGLTACILRLPTNGKNIFLPNNRASLKTSGYIFAEGIRNTFDMAFAPNGDLFGAENGPDRDMSEELNWLRLGGNYGYPWRIGGADNPQQFANYNPATDRLLDPRFNAVQKG
jgi:Glucose / Sorbosone dehydrogenase